MGNRLSDPIRGPECGRRWRFRFGSGFRDLAYLPSDAIGQQLESLEQSGRQADMSDIAVGRNSDGRLEVSARATDDALWHTSQTAAGGSSWNEWQSLRGVLESDLLGEEE